MSKSDWSVTPVLFKQSTLEHLVILKFNDFSIVYFLIALM